MSVTAQRVISKSLTGLKDLERILLSNGRQTLEPKGKWELGDLACYFEPGTYMPKDLVVQLDIAKYLGDDRQVQIVNFRGFDSYGFIASPVFLNGKTVPVEHDLTSDLGCSNTRPVNPNSKIVVGAVLDFVAVLITWGAPKEELRDALVAWVDANNLKMVQPSEFDLWKDF